MAPVVIGATILGGTLQAIGQIKAGDAAQQAADYNAQSAEQSARDARDEAALNEQLQRTQAQKMLGDIGAGYRASGLKVTGSALDVLAESKRNAELDAMMIRKGGERKANAYMRQAEGLRMEGSAAKSASRWAAAGTFLSTGASAAERISKLPKVG